METQFTMRTWHLNHLRQQAHRQLSLRLPGRCNVKVSQAIFGRDVCNVACSGKTLPFNSSITPCKIHAWQYIAAKQMGASWENVENYLVVPVKPAKRKFDNLTDRYWR
jgi:hypothetical protein